MKIKQLILIIVLSCGIIHVNAQETLTLSEAIRLGLQNNFSIQIEKQKKLQASNNNTWGQAGALPNITFNMGPAYSMSDLETDNPFRFGGTTKNSNVNPSVNVAWTIFNGFNVRMTKERLEFLQDQTDGNAAFLIENTVQDIVLAYYNVLLEKERTDVFRSSLDLSGDRYEYSRLKGELGSAVTFDILKDKNSYLTDSSNYITQVLSSRNAKRNLNLLLGRDVDTPVEVSDSLSVVVKNFSLDELYAKMKGSNTNLKNQYINQQIIKRDLGIAKSSMYPTINLNLSGSNNWNTTFLDQPITRQDGSTQSEINSTSLDLSANVTLAFTLFNGGRIQNQIKNAHIQEQIAQLQVDDLELTLKNTLINNFDTYNLRKSLLNIAQENVNTATLNLQLGEDRYKNGSINSFDYRDLQITHLQTALVYYQSIYNLIETEVELMRLIGGILGEYQ